MVSENNNKSVAVLFARRDSIYKSMLGCDVFDKDRDARNYRGLGPVVVHPPCRAWGQLRGLANPEPGEKELAFFALDEVRRCGGVLEHPKGSTLWSVASLPVTGEIDKYGGFTLEVDQFWWGHRAKKATKLYVVGCGVDDVPVMPLALGEASHVCGSPGRRRDGSRLHKGDAGWRPEITKREREATPVEFARWLVLLAEVCRNCD